MTASEFYRRLAARRRLGGLFKAKLPPTRCFANVGRNHPDYGLSPQEHVARKAARRFAGKAA
jgi:hypothetical protein